MRSFHIFTIIYLLEYTSISEALSSKVSSPLSTSPLFQLRNKRYKNELNILGLTSSNYPSHSTSLSKSPLFTKHTLRRAAAASSSTVPDSSPSVVAESTSTTASIKKKRASIEELRKKGGMFSFDTPAGALNLYGIVYGVTAIGLGLIWYVGTMSWKLMHFLSGKRFDKMAIGPILLGQVWGRTLMKLTLADPKIENHEILKNFYKENRAAMIVANHNSWQDIPYLGTTIGWRNYKIIAKKELLKVPILGNAISAGQHVVIDRTNRRSQLMTLKSGIEWLKNGVMLCAFPEGTRSKDGKLQPFKNGAFKMAYKAGAPVIPLSICGAAKVQPSDWMFPLKRAGRDVKVVVHEPVESEGRTEEELARIVREKIIEGLPEDQRP